MLRSPDAAPDDRLPIRALLLWSLVGIAVVVGVVMYFRHARALTPLIG